MLKEIFHDSFENFEITRICMENHASVTGWQKLFISYKCFQLLAAVAIATFETYGWNFSGYPILILLLFQLVLTKSFQKWTVFVFTESWSRDQVMQRAYYLDNRLFRLYALRWLRFCPVFFFLETNYNRILGKINEWWNCCVWAMKAWSTYEVPSLPCLWTYIAL